MAGDATLGAGSTRRDDSAGLGISISVGGLRRAEAAGSDATQGGVGFAPVQLGGLTAVALGGLTAAALGGLTAAALGGLTAAALGGLNAVALGGLTDGVMPGARARCARANVESSIEGAAGMGSTITVSSAGR